MSWHLLAANVSLMGSLPCLEGKSECAECFVRGPVPAIGPQKVVCTWGKESSVNLNMVLNSAHFPVDGAMVICAELHFSRSMHLLSFTGKRVISKIKVL